MARRTKLTRQTQEDICAALAIGATYDAAAVNADITYTTFRNWILAAENAIARRRAGESLGKEDTRYVEFLEAVEAAKGQALLGWQQVIDRHAQNDPQWAWKMLQVRAPKDYMPPATIEVSGKDGGDLRVIIEYDDAGHPYQDTAPA
jgi:hypothetical protein